MKFFGEPQSFLRNQSTVPSWAKQLLTRKPVPNDTWQVHTPWLNMMVGMEAWQREQFQQLVPETIIWPPCPTGGGLPNVAVVKGVLTCATLNTGAWDIGGLPIFGQLVLHRVKNPDAYHEQNGLDPAAWLWKIFV